MAEINLSKAVRPNLSSLHSTSAAPAKTEERLQTSAFDTPTGFLTATALMSRATGMARLLDPISNGIKAIEAAESGLAAMIETVDAMQSALRQRGQDKDLPGISTECDVTSGDGNDPGRALAGRLNLLRDQLNRLADAGSVDGTNLLRGDTLTLAFNETGTATIDIEVRDTDGNATAVNADTLSIDAVSASDVDGDMGIEARLGALGDAMSLLRAHSAAVGASLSVVRDRMDFTRHMIRTLETGAANLAIADTAREAANLRALQTRQPFSAAALSIASQADEAVLRLF